MHHPTRPRRKSAEVGQKLLNSDCPHQAEGKPARRPIPPPPRGAAPNAVGLPEEGAGDVGAVAVRRVGAVRHPDRRFVWRSRWGGGSLPRYPSQGGRA